MIGSEDERVNQDVGTPREGPRTEAVVVADGRSFHRCADCGSAGQYGPSVGEKAALDQLRGLRITGDQIDAAINELGPTGDRAEAYVKVAAGAAAAALRSLASLRDKETAK